MEEEGDVVRMAERIRGNSNGEEGEGGEGEEGGVSVSCFPSIDICNGCFCCGGAKPSTQFPEG